MDPSSEQMAGLARNLALLADNLSQNTDQATSKGLQKQLVMEAKKLIWECQAPFDSIMDHTVNAYAVGTIAALLGIGVFEAVPPSGSATVQEVAQKCDAEEELIIRLMRQLTCVNMFTEVKLHEWAHNKRSIGLSEHVGMSGKFFFQVAMDEMYPSLHLFGQYMKKYGRKDVHTYTETPHSWQNNMVGKNFWQVLDSDPARLDLFNRGLSLFAAMHPVVAMFPFESALQKNNSASRPLAVDIGGGRGLAMLELRKGCPSLQGELILQDRSAVLDTITAEELPGVTKMEHDFFTEQPVKNAQIYLIRRVMHDWLDEDAAKILSSVKPAMALDSRILVSDMALPEPAVPEAAGAIWLDLMMLTIGGKERTSRDWQKLGDMAGLKLVKVWQEPERYGPLCMVEYILPEAAESSGVDGGVQEQTLKAKSGDDAAVSTPMSGENKDEDWEEKTVVGDRDQSVEPGQ